MKATHYINGQWVLGEGEAFTSTCSSSGDEIWQGHQASFNETSLAVSSAQNAFTSWSLLTFDERHKYLTHYVAGLKEQEESLSLAISQEAGKPLWEAKTEVSAMVSKLQASVNAYHQRTASTSSESKGLETRLTHRPHGVVAILGPYNFPGHLPNGQMIPALLAGNTLVFKPSELTPKVAAIMMDCFDKAKLPKGVVNCIQGDGQVGQALLTQDIVGVYFTGSYQTGRKIHQHFAGRPEIILALEMGGNNPLIIDEVHDIDAAVFHTVMSAYITSGQRCTCARRLLLPDNTFGEQFLSALTDKISSLTVGPYWQEPEPFMGAVVSNRMAESLLETQEQLIANGAQAIIEMKRRSQAILTPGIIDVSTVDDGKDEELFGPLLQISRYKTIDEAIVQANHTAYGLSAGLISDNVEHQHQYYQQIRAGIVNINRQMTGASGMLPFGGIGKSGNHRPAAAYTADFCAYPMASLIEKQASMPEVLPVGY